MKLTSEELDIYKAEWSHCEEGISRYDGLTFQIRGWATSAVAALLAAAVAVGQNKLALIAMLVAFLFWLIDAMHKTYQSVFIDRSHEIQTILKKSLQESLTNEMKQLPMIGEKFELSWEIPIDSFSNIIKTGCNRNNALIYLSLLIVSISSYFLISPHL